MKHSNSKGHGDPLNTIQGKGARRERCYAAGCDGTH